MPKNDCEGRFPHPPLREEGYGKGALNQTETVGAHLRYARTGIPANVSIFVGAHQI